MKLPDKVYLNKFMIRPGMLHPAEFPPDNPEEEYIRKEALLEWARGELSHADANIEAYPYEDAYRGHREKIEELIEKLNSL